MHAPMLVWKVQRSTNSAHAHVELALYPGPPFNFAHGGPGSRCDGTFNQRGCVHGDASLTMIPFQSAHGQVAA